jgi:hypothetical protein
MPKETVLTKEDLRKLRPSTFFKKHGGFGDPEQSRDGALGNLVTGACLTFEDAEVAPQELLTVYEAIKQCLEMTDAADPGQKLRQAVDEAFDITATVLGKDVNGAIVDWIRECLPFVKTEEDIAAFLQHLSSLVQQYSLVMSLKHGAS